MQDYSNINYESIEETTAWNRVQKSRMQNRPQARDYIVKLCDDFFEVHGDRCYGNDKAIITGVGSIMNTVVTIIGQCKGHKLQEKKECNFGMPKPCGYRKSMRAINQAEKFNRPIVCFVDTPGAYCGIDAEEKGQGTVIAEHLQKIAGAKVPIISIIIGEGGSGGALALCICDRLFALQNSYFSVISPEGCASILFKDSTKADIAAHNLCLEPDNLVDLGIVDLIIKEPEVFMVDTMHDVVNQIKFYIKTELDVLQNYHPKELVENRYKKILNSASVKL